MKIFYYFLSGIGDAIQAIPSWKAIKQRYPHCILSVLVGYGAAELLLSQNIVDEIIVYDKEQMSWYEKLRLLCNLYKEKYEIAIAAPEPPNRKKNAFIALLSGAKRRIGSKSDVLSSLYTTRINVDIGLSEFERHSCVVEHFGVSPVLPNQWLDVDSKAIEWVRSRIHPSLYRNRFVCVCNGGVGQIGTLKKWPVEKFSHVIRWVLKKTDMTVVAVGSTNEHQYWQKCREMLDNDFRFLNVAGKSSITQAVALISESALLVTNDTGNMHIAVATNTPLVVLFGPVRPGERLPERANIWPIVPKTSCAPCYPNWVHCKNAECMNSITTGEVIDAIKVILR